MYLSKQSIQRNDATRYHLCHCHRPRWSHRSNSCFRPRSHQHHLEYLHAHQRTIIGRTETLYPHLRENPFIRRRNHRRSISFRFPCSPLLHRRRFYGNLLPRLIVYSSTSDASPHRVRMPIGRTGRIYPTGFPQRKNGLEPSRSRGRCDSLFFGSYSPVGHESDARRIQSGTLCTEG